LTMVSVAMEVAVVVAVLVTVARLALTPPCMRLVVSCTVRTGAVGSIFCSVS
jgi:hypothetical protein